MKNGPYILIKAPEGYPRKKYRGLYAYEHHVVWWQNKGTLPSNSEWVIHHKDHDKHNNSIENLEETTLSRHTKEHKAENPAKTDIVVCSWCGIKIVRAVRTIRQNKKAKYKNSYCSTSHQMFHQWSVGKV